MDLEEERSRMEMQAIGLSLDPKQRGIFEHQKKKLEELYLGRIEQLEGAMEVLGKSSGI